MTEKNVMKIRSNNTQSIDFITSIGNSNDNNHKSKFMTFKKIRFSKIIADLYLMIELVLELRHVRYTLRFATNTSFEAVVHYSLNKICNTFEISHSVIEIIDWFFYLSIVLLAINFTVNLVKDTVFTVKGISVKNSPTGIEKIDNIKNQTGFFNSEN